MLVWIAFYWGLGRKNYTLVFFTFQEKRFFIVHKKGAKMGRRKWGFGREMSNNTRQESENCIVQFGIVRKINMDFYGDRNCSILTRVVKHLKYTKIIHKCNIAPCNCNLTLWKHTIQVRLIGNVATIVGYKTFCRIPSLEPMLLSSVLYKTVHIDILHNSNVTCIKIEH